MFFSTFRSVWAWDLQEDLVKIFKYPQIPQNSKIPSTARRRRKFLGVFWGIIPSILSQQFVTIVNLKQRAKRWRKKLKHFKFPIFSFSLKKQFETFQNFKYGPSKNSLKFETNINLKHHPKRARKKLKHFKFSFIFI